MMRTRCLSLTTTLPIVHIAPVQHKLRIPVSFPQIRTPTHMYISQRSNLIPGLCPPDPILARQDLAFIICNDSTQMLCPSQSDIARTKIKRALAPAAMTNLSTACVRASSHKPFPFSLFPTSLTLVQFPGPVWALQYALSSWIKTRCQHVLHVCFFAVLCFERILYVYVFGTVAPVAPETHIRDLRWS